MRVRKDSVLEAQLIDNVEYAVIVDSDGTTAYIGRAKIGSSGASAVWQVKKLVTSGNVTTTTWADGNSSFDNVWDNRASLSYS